MSHLLNVFGLVRKMVSKSAFKKTHQNKTEKLKIATTRYLLLKIFSFDSASNLFWSLSTSLLYSSSYLLWCPSLEIHSANSWAFRESLVSWSPTFPDACLEFVFLRSLKAFTTFLSAFSIQSSIPVPVFAHSPWPSGFIPFLKYMYICTYIYIVLVVFGKRTKIDMC